MRIHQYNTDHLGSVRAVLNQSMTVLEQNDYYPFGLRHQNSALKTADNRYRYNGKEEIAADATSDYGARQYSAEFCQWLQVDPLSEKFYSTSPYGFCAGNPLRFVDLDGLAWRPTFTANGLGDQIINGYEWVEPEESYDIQGNLLEGLYEAVVWFQGSRDEKLGEGDNLFGKGAKLANVIAYGTNGEDDITNYQGYTMSSNPSHFGVIEEGDYTVNHLDPNDTPGPYGSDLIIEKRWKHIPAKNGVNPAHPDRTPGYLVNVFIHRPNKNGWAGTFMENGNLRGVSEGCLLIAPNDWDNFNSKMKSAKSFHLKLTR